MICSVAENICSLAQTEGQFEYDVVARGLTEAPAMPVQKLSVIILHRTRINVLAMRIDSQPTVNLSCTLIARQDIGIGHEEGCKIKVVAQRLVACDGNLNLGVLLRRGYDTRRRGAQRGLDVEIRGV